MHKSERRQNTYSVCFVTSRRDKKECEINQYLFLRRYGLSKSMCSVNEVCCRPLGDKSPGFCLKKKAVPRSLSTVSAGISVSTSAIVYAKAPVKDIELMGRALLICPRWTH